MVTFLSEEEDDSFLFSLDILAVEFRSGGGCVD